MPFTTQIKVLQTSLLPQEFLGSLSFPNILGFVSFSFCRGSVFPFFFLFFFLVNECYQETCAAYASLSIISWAWAFLLSLQFILSYRLP